ncbi:Protein kinase domain [Carpediemonas membranifera]|uniref:Protein kinase domain n=1 Tax=Carpediemonas membranifera TaxID=201153 RepID=A0A8J6DXY3_9EUKA|nr:Protein kinase domain [Carpediemonas membranifera]|eukprot:KAG9391209.1 Protein kinase domain [Carpediemonas membranifera]
MKAAVFALLISVLLFVVRVKADSEVGSWLDALVMPPPDGYDSFGPSATDGSLVVTTVRSSSKADSLYVYTLATGKETPICRFVRPGQTIKALATDGNAVAVVHSTSDGKHAFTVYMLSDACPAVAHHQPAFTSAADTYEKTFGTTISMNQNFLAVGAAGVVDSQGILGPVNCRVFVYYDFSGKYGFAKNVTIDPAREYGTGTIAELGGTALMAPTGNLAGHVVVGMPDANKAVFYSLTRDGDGAHVGSSSTISVPDSKRLGETVATRPNTADAGFAVGSEGHVYHYTSIVTMNDMRDLYTASAPALGSLVDFQGTTLVALDNSSSSTSMMVGTFLETAQTTPSSVTLLPSVQFMTLYDSGRSLVLGNTTHITTRQRACGSGYGIHPGDAYHVCSACNNGYYGPGQRFLCSQAAAGYVVADDGKAHTTETPCNNGLYQPSAGKTTCLPCPTLEGTPKLAGQGFAACTPIMPPTPTTGLVYFNNSLSADHRLSAATHDGRAVLEVGSSDLYFLVPLVAPGAYKAGDTFQINVTRENDANTYSRVLKLAKDVSLLPTGTISLDQQGLHSMILGPICPYGVVFGGAEKYPLNVTRGISGTDDEVTCVCSRSSPTSQVLLAFKPTLPNSFELGKDVCLTFDFINVDEDAAADFTFTISGKRFEGTRVDNQACAHNVELSRGTTGKVPITVLFKDEALLKGTILVVAPTPEDNPASLLPYVEIVSIPAVILLILVVMLCCLCCACAACLGCLRHQLRRRKEGRLRTRARGELMKIGADVRNDLYRSIIDFYIPPSSITEVHSIASGGFGTVSVAAYGAGIVCLKRLHPMLQADPQSMDEFAREALHMVSLRHRSVVPFLGATIIDGVVHLLTEYCPFGSLDKYVAKMKSDGTYSHAKLVDLLIDCGEGLAFIHSRGVIHRDIKPDNFFVGVHTQARQSGKTNSVVGKIGDFGLAVSKKAMTMTNIGTVGYSSPEVLSGTHYETSTDVFSFGMTIFTLFSGMQPFEKENSSFVVQSRMINGERPPIEGVPRPLIPIIKRCWAQSPSARPSMEEVVRSLRRARKEADKRQSLL